MTAVIPTLESQLKAGQIVRREHIAATLVPALKAATVDGVMPEAMVFPETEAELCEVMACAYRHRWRVLPLGSGSKLQWGGLAAGFDLAVCTDRLNQVIDHAVGDMTLTAAAGLTLADLKPQLAQHNQFLAIDPAYSHRATLGGIVATADTGSLRQRYNSVRDMLIGISFVRYDGQIAKAGGRVVKNVAGYDLMKLMTGAYGSLGVISQVTFRLYPVPPALKAVAVFGTAEDIGNLTAKLRRSSLTPTALDLLSPQLAGQLNFPTSFALVAQFQSNVPGVDEQVDRLFQMASAPLTSKLLTGHEPAECWDGVAQVLFPAIQNQTYETAPVIAKVGVLPDSAMTLLSKLGDIVPEAGFARVHVSSGIGTITLPADLATVDVIQQLRLQCEAFGGYLTILQAPKSLKQSIDVWGYSGDALPIMKRIKTTFDPHNLLNPGRFVGGL
jgi:glycolate oxidase FAD binding subunit